jgi:hypothetical protein
MRTSPVQYSFLKRKEMSVKWIINENKYGEIPRPIWGYSK